MKIFRSRPDAVISKLIWISKGARKCRRDVCQLMLRATQAEMETVRSLAQERNLEPLLDEVLTEPDEIDV